MGCIMLSLCEKYSPLRHLNDGPCVYQTAALTTELLRIDDAIGYFGDRHSSSMALLSLNITFHLSLGRVYTKPGLAQYFSEKGI